MGQLLAGGIPTDPGQSPTIQMGVRALAEIQQGWGGQPSIPAGQLLVSGPLPHSRSKGRLPYLCSSRRAKGPRFKHSLSRLKCLILIDEIWNCYGNKALGISVSGCLRLSEVGRPTLCVGIIPGAGVLD